MRLPAIACTLALLAAAPAQALTFTFDDGGGDGYYFDFSDPAVPELYNFWLQGSDSRVDPGEVLTSLSSVADRGYRVRGAFTYLTYDYRGPGSDPFGYFLDDDVVQLSMDDGPNEQSGVFDVELRRGQAFGFYVYTEDNLSDFAGAVVTAEIAPIPLPPAMALMLAALAGLGLVRRLRRA